MIHIMKKILRRPTIQPKIYKYSYLLKDKKKRNCLKKETRLEIRLKDSWDVLKNAENLTSKVGMALGLLRSGISGQLEDIMVKQDMGLRIIKAQEAERKRVSREIHDGPAQQWRISLLNLIT